MRCYTTQSEFRMAGHCMITWSPDSYKLIVSRRYKAYLAHITQRTNTINGLQYADDSTILAWELLNEPRCQVTDGCALGTVAVSALQMHVTFSVSMSLSSLPLLSAGHSWQSAQAEYEV